MFGKAFQGFQFVMHFNYAEILWRKTQQIVEGNAKRLNDCFRPRPCENVTAQIWGSWEFGQSEFYLET